MMDEDEAERIRASRGNYEIEVSFTEEVGLHQSKRTCDKNPGHLNFIPVKDFNIEHLPSRYRDDLLVDYVRATSDLTCRLSVSRISGDRPKTWPGSERLYPFSSLRGKNCKVTGTGWVSEVLTSEDSACECDECNREGNTPKKTWGQIWITTASHVVCNEEEAKHAKCHFFYDSHGTDINKFVTFTDLKLCYSHIEGDKCELNYFTHDTKLMDKFDKMYWGLVDIREKVTSKYLSNKSPGLSVPGVGCDTNVDHDLCIIVSHPHGCTKVVTIGTLTHRDVVKKDTDSDTVDITYRYNTPTCPGSSGAIVIALYTKSIYDHPPHSEGRPGNENNSGLGMERIISPDSDSPLTDSQRLSAMSIMTSTVTLACTLAATQSVSHSPTLSHGESVLVAAHMRLLKCYNDVHKIKKKLQSEKSLPASSYEA